MPHKVPTALDLSGAERAGLEGWARRRKTAARALAPRARIALRAAADADPEPSRWAKSAGRALAGPGRSRPRAPDAAVGAEGPAPARPPASAG